jgi:hypothetical protein
LPEGWHPFLKNKDATPWLSLQRFQTTCILRSRVLRAPWRLSSMVLFGNTQPRSGTLRQHSHDSLPLLNRHNDVSQINEALIIDFLRSHIIKRNIVL